MQANREHLVNNDHILYWSEFLQDVIDVTLFQIARLLSLAKFLSSYFLKICFHDQNNVLYLNMNKPLHYFFKFSAVQTCF